MNHPNDEVRAAMILLCDALCNYERACGRQSILIFMEQDRLEFRAVNGKPVPPDVPDSKLFEMAENW